MAEPGQLPRKILKHTPAALNAADGSPVGHVLNLDPQGLMLQREEALAPGERLDIRVAMDEHGGEPWTLRCTLEVLWCERAAAEAHYWVGCAIAELDEDANRRIEHLIGAA